MDKQKSEVNSVWLNERILILKSEKSYQEQLPVKAETLGDAINQVNGSYKREIVLMLRTLWEKQ